MKLIIITEPEFFEGEAAIVNALFGLGMERLHLRKPGATEGQLREWIGQIEPSFRQRIVLHDHHGLARTMGLGGIHLNSRNPLPPQWIVEEKLCGHQITVSRSCHTVNEIAEYGLQCDYLFLSPVFDSISKQGYHAAFSDGELQKAVETIGDLFQQKVYALGGITLSRLPKVRTIRFCGAAVLGDIWNKRGESHSALLRTFLEYMENINGEAS